MTQKKKIAIYPGSFNPFTIGHLNILEKAEAIFGVENVIIAVGINPEKTKTIAVTDTIGTLAIGHVPVDRVATIKQNLSSKNVEKFSGFLTDYVWEKEQAGFDVTIVKGLRNGKDLDYEVNQLRFMEEMKPNVKVMFLVCDKQFEHVSSSAYRMFEAIREGSGHRYIAKEYPVITSEMAGSAIHQVFVEKDEVDILKKYILVPESKSISTNYNFSGTYTECLTWIKEQEAK